MIPTNFNKKMFILFLLMVLTGCTATRISRSFKEMNHGDIQKIEIGETTKNEVLSLFGPPTAITINSQGIETFTFVYADSQSQMWQIPPIIVIYVDSVSSSKTKVLTVGFSGDTVINWNFTVSSAGGGFQAGGVQGGKLE